MGSLERFSAVLLEHLGGVFPLWLSPVQTKILSIAERHQPYARELQTALRDAGIRVELDESNETLGKKIREAKMQKIPYFLVIGDKEMEAKTVTVESRDGKNKGSMTLQNFLEILRKEISERS